MKAVKGDLIELAKAGNFDILIHRCNCFNTMGGGIARQLRQRYHEVFEADRETSYGDRSKLGTYSIAVTEDGFVVVNAYTQYLFGEDPQAKDGVLLDYDALQKAFTGIKEQFGNQNLRFGIPKIGAGLARGDWNRISEIIEGIMEGEDITVVEYAP